ncbi:hypothetical protein K488DRAFT_72117 [Vararia minispora EC-137]|uniref:Uncharacterized protein n=1 Tax=Vararia minispora EC-137 TaxID=1314806 RepID=A0ACB8QFR1_9AGAM|nr:hypothetical protein K488DRAFT_72117 [Vararia minispora EC-137]
MANPGSGHPSNEAWQQDMVHIPELGAKLLLFSDCATNGGVLFPDDGSHPYPIRAENLASYVQSLQVQSRTGQRAMERLSALGQAYNNSRAIAPPPPPAPSLASSQSNSLPQTQARHAVPYTFVPYYQTTGAAPGQSSNSFPGHLHSPFVQHSAPQAQVPQRWPTAVPSNIGSVSYESMAAQRNRAEFVQVSSGPQIARTSNAGMFRSWICSYPLTSVRSGKPPMPPRRDSAPMNSAQQNERVSQHSAASHTTYHSHPRNLHGAAGHSDGSATRLSTQLTPTSAPALQSPTTVGQSSTGVIGRERQPPLASHSGSRAGTGSAGLPHYTSSSSIPGSTTPAPGGPLSRGDQVAPHTTTSWPNFQAKPNPYLKNAGRRYESGRRPTAGEVRQDLQALQIHGQRTAWAIVLVKLQGAGHAVRVSPSPQSRKSGRLKEIEEYMFSYRFNVLPSNPASAASQTTIQHDILPDGTAHRQIAVSSMQPLSSLPINGNASVPRPTQGNLTPASAHTDPFSSSAQLSGDLVNAAVSQSQVGPSRQADVSTANPPTGHQPDVSVPEYDSTVSTLLEAEESPPEIVFAQKDDTPIDEPAAGLSTPREHGKRKVSDLPRSQILSPNKRTLARDLLRSLLPSSKIHSEPVSASPPRPSPPFVPSPASSIPPGQSNSAANESNSSRSSSLSAPPPDRARATPSPMPVKMPAAETLHSPVVPPSELPHNKDDYKSPPLAASTSDLTSPVSGIPQLDSSETISAPLSELASGIMAQQEHNDASEFNESSRRMLTATGHTFIDLTVDTPSSQPHSEPPSPAMDLLANFAPPERQFEHNLELPAPLGVAPSPFAPTHRMPTPPLAARISIVDEDEDEERDAVVRDMTTAHPSEYVPEVTLPPPTDDLREATVPPPNEDVPLELIDSDVDADVEMDLQEAVLGDHDEQEVVPVSDAEDGQTEESSRAVVDTLLPHKDGPRSGSKPGVAQMASQRHLKEGVTPESSTSINCGDERLRTNHAISHFPKKFLCPYVECGASLRAPEMRTHEQKAHQPGDHLLPMQWPKKPRLGTLLQALPEILPAYLSDTRPVKVPRLPADRHAKLGPYVLTRIFGDLDSRGVRDYAKKQRHSSGPDSLIPSKRHWSFSYGVDHASTPAWLSDIELISEVSDALREHVDGCVNLYESGDEEEGTPTPESPRVDYGSGSDGTIVEAMEEDTGLIKVLAHTAPTRTSSVDVEMEILEGLL